MSQSPTERTLDECRRRGWIADVTERWIPGTGQIAGRRRDLFGFIDVLAIQPPAPEPAEYQYHSICWGIQATSGGNISHRLDKIRGDCSAHAMAWLSVSDHRLAIWGWRKLETRRWCPRCDLDFPITQSKVCPQCRKRARSWQLRAVEITSQMLESPVGG